MADTYAQLLFPTLSASTFSITSTFFSPFGVLLKFNTRFFVDHSKIPDGCFLHLALRRILLLLFLHRREIMKKRNKEGEDKKKRIKPSFASGKCKYVLQVCVSANLICTMPCLRCVGVVSLEEKEKDEGF